jgi:nitroreductase
MRYFESCSLEKHRHKIGPVPSNGEVGNMEQDELYEAIFKRRSVRKYAPGNLDASMIERVVSKMAVLTPLFSGIHTELRLMTNSEVRGMFKVDAPHFLAFFSEVKEGYASNAGFMMQQMDLFLSANGIGSCWQGGPKPIREARQASDLEFVTLLAFGPPAEDVHRKSVSEFDRKPLAKISDVKGNEEMLEPARLAPSGMNNQPWFFTEGNGAIHVSSAKSVLVDRMNRISTGNALCHLWLAAAHSGRTVEFRSDRSGEVNAPKKYSYVASLIVG